MTTKLYLHDAANAQSGTFPNNFDAALGGVASWAVTGAATLRTMDKTIGTAQTSRTGTSLASTSLQNGDFGFWVSPPLSGAQTVGGGTITVNHANSESNTNMNLDTDVRVWIEVWRPGSGTSVGAVTAGPTLTGPLEPTAAPSEQVSHGTMASSAISAADGDVIVARIQQVHTQAMATAYNGIVFYDGTTENTTENAVVSNHASFLLLTETLAFQAPATNITVNLTGQSATASVGTVTPSYNTTVSLTGRSATASVGTVTPSIAVTLAGQAGTASVGTVTETYTGQKTLTGQSATASVGTVTRQIDNNPALTGLSATASVGTVTETYTSTATLTGQSMTASVGTVTPTIAGNITVNLSGQSMTASTGTVTVDVPVPGPTVYYQGAGHPGKHLRRRKRIDLFDSIEATLREAVYGPEEPEPTPEPAVIEAVAQLEEISQGNADLIERLAVLKAELADYRKIQAEKEKLKRLELLRQQEEDDEEAWLMVA